jgi:hypothetical protein
MGIPGVQVDKSVNDKDDLDRCFSCQQDEGAAGLRVHVRSDEEREVGCERKQQMIYPAVAIVAVLDGVGLRPKPWR